MPDIPGSEAAEAVPARASVREPMAAPAQRPLAPLAAALGNRSLGRLLARMPSGAGLLDGGVVHPEVEAGIARVSGGGRGLDPTLSQRLEAGYGTTLGDVRVHTDPHAAQLARAVSAQAFTVGRDIFFGADAYRPGTSSGDALVAHEVAHVVQQRGAPAAGPLVATRPGDVAERGAEDAASALGY